MDGDKKSFRAMGALYHARRALWYNLGLNESGAVEVYARLVRYILKKDQKLPKRQ